MRHNNNFESFRYNISFKAYLNNLLFLEIALHDCTVRPLLMKVYYWVTFPLLYSNFSVTFQLLFSLPECAPFTDESAQWHHGAFFVNGFNVGRYHQVGPQKTLYVPGPLLKQGTNEVGISSTNVLPHSIKLVFSLYYLPIYYIWYFSSDIVNMNTSFSQHFNA